MWIIYFLFRVLAGITRAVWGFVKVSVTVALTLFMVVVSGNLVFHAQRGIPYRALSADTPACKDGIEKGWDILSQNGPGRTPNSEWSAIDRDGQQWRTNFACVVQRHTIPNYKAQDGTPRTLSYNLAFIEFREDGKPYAIREHCTQDEANCEDEGFGKVKPTGKNQLDAVVANLNPKVPNYVMVFVHGWRNDASIGNENVADFRQYAAHAARFIEDRAASPNDAAKPVVTAIFVGWRGARTDETWLRRKLGTFGDWMGGFFAVGTLFDRKPVSEAIAPSVLAGLRAIENRLKIAHEFESADAVPPENPNKMIVFGHSLGGDLLITALNRELVKKVVQHTPGTLMQPVLGDLVVLINPAAEAGKWMDIQRAVWQRMAISIAERRTLPEYEAAHQFFQPHQAPVIVSVTAARDWPPGGRRETDCFQFSSEENAKQQEKAQVVLNEGFQYDWATYDLFPFFKGDFRPAADTLERLALKTDPHDACDRTSVSWWRRTATFPIVALSWFLRVAPFMQTDPEQTRTIGHLDPPRAPRGSFQNEYFPGSPFGTTHELRGIEPSTSRTEQKTVGAGATTQELPLTYLEVISPQAACPRANGWLFRARQETLRSEHCGHGVSWDSALAGARAPALQFRHGFRSAGITPITRANDPFWNIRAFDTALVHHDGYMLSSFICSMNQLVMDDPGDVASLIPAGQALANADPPIPKCQ